MYRVKYEKRIVSILAACKHYEDIEKRQKRVCGRQRIMEQFEQLLTCAICLDRYRNPKLLPCQHSFCMEPCMEGLVDYVRRQVKCPECRAEHRIPYQGVQGFPTNVTLQRFLELHIEITGELPDPTSGQVQFILSSKNFKTF
ncbi:unnamed protein product [Acanthoscelides obtectus]|uniref:RING-type domain-containing protein n=2 Tax=Acanthoscelides obtectus TaxID=200917 RepID=A0A9P0LR79_ACAOB|nr:unnamed protein product [Acanthoscelides obtectus]CAK1621656.1 RING finger protein nhl-1 [Acanthoscelides obtectus]